MTGWLDAQRFVLLIREDDGEDDDEQENDAVDAVDAVVDDYDTDDDVVGGEVIFGLRSDTHSPVVKLLSQAGSAHFPIVQSSGSL